MRAGWVFLAIAFGAASIACGGATPSGGINDGIEPRPDGSVLQPPENPGEPEFTGLPGLMVGVLESFVAEAKLPVVDITATPYDQVSVALPLFLGACTQTSGMLGAQLEQVETCQLPGVMSDGDDGDPIPEFASTFQIGCDYRLGPRFFEIAYALTVEDIAPNRPAWDHYTEFSGGSLRSMENAGTDCIDPQKCCAVQFSSVVTGTNPIDQPGVYLASIDFPNLSVQDEAQQLRVNMSTTDLEVVYVEDPDRPWDWESGRAPTRGTLSASGTWTGENYDDPIGIQVETIEPLVLSEGCTNYDFPYPHSELAADFKYSRIYNSPSPFVDGIVEVSQDDGTCDRIRWLDCGRIAVIPCEWAD